MVVTKAGMMDDLKGDLKAHLMGDCLVEKRAEMMATD